jgi:enoyl-CoA hydratase/carnithine racemase
MAYETIRVDVAENIQTITLHRPERLNAFTRQMMQELIDAFGAADADDRVRAVIVTGAGRAFCAGADLSGGAGTFERSEATGRPQGGRARGLFRRGTARRRRPRHAPHLRVP